MGLVGRSLGRGLERDTDVVQRRGELARDEVQRLLVDRREAGHASNTRYAAPPAARRVSAVSAPAAAGAGLILRPGAGSCGGSRKPEADLRSCADMSARRPIAVEVALVLSAVCWLISRSTCMVR